MKTILLAFGGTVLVSVAIYLLISFLSWQINPVMWWDEKVTTIGAIFRMAIMIFTIMYLIIKTEIK